MARPVPRGGQHGAPSATRGHAIRVLVPLMNWHRSVFPAFLHMTRCRAAPFTGPTVPSAGRTRLLGASGRRRCRILAESNSDNGPPTSQPAPRPSFADPAQTVAWGGTLPSTRRAALGGLAGLSVALVGNLFGLSSFLLGLDGGRTAAGYRLDALIPVKGYKRCLDYQNGYEFLYPAAWLADQRLYRRYAERVERKRGLDLPSLRGIRRPRSEVPEPTAAFGPPGGTGEDNISVIVADIREGFQLENMGSPQDAARRFLDDTVAPPGSGKVATLLAAGARRDATGELYYEMEFTVEAAGKFSRHNAAAYAARNGLLFTLNAQCSEERWGQLQEQFRTAVESFHVISSGGGTAGFPERL